jgi:hypothetical protein
MRSKEMDRGCVRNRIADCHGTRGSGRPRLHDGAGNRIRLRPAVEQQQLLLSCPLLPEADMPNAVPDVRFRG